MTIQRATADLYDPTGVTLIGALTNARNIKWQDILSQSGTASFEIPLDDTITASIADRCIVKFSLYGAVRFGCRISTEAVQLAVDGRRWLRFENQPGLLQMLADALVMPEYGLDAASLGANSTAAGSRIFGFMSIDGPWRVTADWQAPLASSWATDPYRPKSPPDLAINNPDWIAFDDPTDPTVPNGTYNYFRCLMTVPGIDVVSLQFTFTGDNFFTLYFDGVELISADLTQPFGWMTSKQVSVNALPGDHMLAAKVLNAGIGPPVPGPMGLIGVVYNLDAATGQRTTVFVQTDTVNWIVAKTPVPGWTRAQVLKKLVEEAQAVPCAGPAALTIGFTDTDDSASVPWADAPDEYTFSVASSNLADIATQLTESGMDVDVDPSTMTLNAWVRRGSNLSGSVELKLGDASGTLRGYETKKTVARFTDVISQLSDGTWVQTTDAAAVTALGGHVQVGLALGSTSTPDSAMRLSEGLLAESAIPQIEVTSQPSALAGAQAYIDYQMGDTITVPGHRNAGTMKARVLSITVDNSGDVLAVWPQFVPDLSV